MRWAILLAVAAIVLAAAGLVILLLFDYRPTLELVHRP